MKKGLFITVEGIEGAGKTTNLNFIRSILEESGEEVVMTREPGGTPMAEEVRELLLRPREEAVSSTAELLLMFAARAQHLEQKIKPTIERGVHVLSDRFTDATYAYQGGGRGLSWAMIQDLEKLVQAGFKPDLTLLLRIDPETGMARARKRGALDRFEREKLEFYFCVQEGYMKRVAEDPERFLVVDAQQSLEEVQAAIAQGLAAKLAG
ncbi:thymidylate kinase [Hahella chejuensis KCTC 2396]|uniref:Thymidylate kinase n=1 Tax=Hahella chejuensis (strain KCTC 2396) TaxID=349521 RepID=KTHY_HAHCH|nr:dTMP kinase [Hahella chejuensis]Q2SK46.1 RecName: Full=Thymidylate kinase; AltName: Full=dTMP kinase [Hahella chejuensis KCTC 2396]ABC28978.1 thymidylate kinase [Hahella chejuensis KCTC 2396]